MNAALALLALATLGSAAAAMMGRNLLRSIFMLAVSWAGVAAFYMWADAQFLAFAQVLIYLGAISMVALFAVLLTRQSREDPPPEAARGRAVLAVLAAAGVAAVLLWAVTRSPLAVAAAPAPKTTVRQLGADLMGQHGAALLVVGVLLTSALLGAVVLAANDAQERPGDQP
jgi:NADH:ubiquinone oxidoreductase subunit 6 (subunit J)